MHQLPVVQGLEPQKTRLVFPPAHPHAADVEPSLAIGWTGPSGGFDLTNEPEDG